MISTWADEWMLVFYSSVFCFAPSVSLSMLRTS